MSSLSSSSSPSSFSSSARHSHSAHSYPDTLEYSVPPKNTLKAPDDSIPRPENIFSLSQSEELVELHMERSNGRTVQIFDASDRETEIGGLKCTTGITNMNLYSMIEVWVFLDGEYTISNENGVTIQKDGSQLQPGKYYIHSTHPLQINNEVPLFRVQSQGSGTRIPAFGNAVRLRDNRCIVTQEEVPYTPDPNWSGFEAAHIFPLAHQTHWVNQNYGRWITVPSTTGGSINSVQNGLLLRADIHQHFDGYFFSINPDDNYKIVDFGRILKGNAGRHLDRTFLDNPQRPPDELLRWHFRQAVLVNMKGAGEPVFEHDFPPGSDIVGSILRGPKAAERMEFELFDRLAVQLDLAE